jgi:hypothetical protein
MKTLGGAEGLPGINIDTSAAASAITLAGTRAQDAIGVLSTVVQRQFEGVFMALDNMSSRISVLQGAGKTMEGNTFNARVPS